MKVVPNEPLAASKIVGGGWLPPRRSILDYSVDSAALNAVLKTLKLPYNESKTTAVLPKRVDLRDWCSPVKNQGLILSCTGFAATGMVEYFEKRVFSKYIDSSALFLYKVTRKLNGSVGDTGAGLRDVMKALALFGVPDEKFWPYTDRLPGFDEEPAAFTYAIAGNYKAREWFCHDQQNANNPSNVLYSVKQFLAAGIPSMFGFYKFPCFNLTNKQGHIPYPANVKDATIAHAVLAVGYDDTFEIKSEHPGTMPTTGALLVRNCQGLGWGDSGYGWLPYGYVLNKLAHDFWSLLSMDWVDTDQFGIADNT